MVQRHFWLALIERALEVMWEHFVLNELMTPKQSRNVAYWGDKRGHEIDFVLARHRKKPLAIECKWSADSFDPTSLRAFRQQHPAREKMS